MNEEENNSPKIKFDVSAGFVIKLAILLFVAVFLFWHEPQTIETRSFRAYTPEKNEDEKFRDKYMKAKRVKNMAPVMKKTKKKPTLAASWKAILYCSTSFPWFENRTDKFERLSDDMAIMYNNKYMFIFTPYFSKGYKIFKGVFWQKIFLTMQHYLLLDFSDWLPHKSFVFPVGDEYHEVQFRRGVGMNLMSEFAPKEDVINVSMWGPKSVITKSGVNVLSRELSHQLSGFQTKNSEIMPFYRKCSQLSKIGLKT